MSLIKFYGTVLWVGITLGMLGQLKACTQVMLGLSAEKTRVGIISCSVFSHLLTR